MNFAEYSAFVKSVAGAHKNAVNPLEYYSLGLFGEAGELANLVKKIEYHKHPFDEKMKAKLVEEIGDCFWYLTAWFCEADPVAAAKAEFGEYYKPTTVPSIRTWITFLALNCGDIMSNSRDAERSFFSAISKLIGILKHYGVTLDQAIAANVAKLKLRYPNGFTEEASLNRKG